MIGKLVLLLAVATGALGKSTRIIGGSDAAVGEIVFMASVQDKNNEHYCGGVIVSATQVLTTAACAESGKPSEGRILAGMVDITEVGVEHKVSDVVLHPDYSNTNSTPLNNIAIITVQPPFTFDATTGRAFLPVQGYDTPAGLECTISGWGTISLGGEKSNILQKATVPIVSKELCSEAYSDVGLPENQICAGYFDGGVDACVNDGGSPLFENGVVYGLVSWGHGCGEPLRPGVYTEISAHRDWIEANLL